MKFPSDLWLLDASSAVLLNQIEARSPAAGSSPAGYRVQQGIAIIQCCGLMLKDAEPWWSPVGVVSTVALRGQFRQAAADPNVKGILFVVSSGGGQSDGTLELAADIRDAAKQKPLFAFAQDAAASAAYWCASQAHKLYTNELGKVGSIGAYRVVIDSAGAAAKEGVIVHLVKSGPHKGAGYPGTAVSPEHLADVQASVNRIHETFVAAVAAGRRVSPKTIQAAADGRVYLPDQAAKLKLIDGVCTLDTCFAALHQITTAGTWPAGLQSSAPPSRGTNAMDAKSQIEELVEQRMQEKPRLSRAEAMQEVLRENEELRAAWVADHNRQHAANVHRGRR